MPDTILAIVADDLTGALDAAAPFATIEGGVVVATSPEALGRALATRPGVVAVSSRSREVPAAEARRRAEQVLRLLPAGVRVLTKIDSRLKGNIAAELEALGDFALVVLPAIPDFGRIVRDGALQGFGVERPIPVRPVLGRFAASAEVPDTVSQDDMVAAVHRAPGDAVLAGARGLAQALAGSMGLAPPPLHPILPAPTCVAVGSTDPITLAQVERLRATLPHATYLAAPAGRVPAPGPSGAAITLIQATPGGEAAAADVAREFARGLRPHLAAARSVLLTGGATAEAALDALGVTVLTVAGEAAPGMAACRTGGLVVVTKSGGFGDPDTLVRLAPREALA
jgi:uncharacterized protein YgbK (DUF1537 family)